MVELRGDEEPLRVLCWCCFDWRCEHQDDAGGYDEREPPQQSIPFLADRVPWSGERIALHLLPVSFAECKYRSS